MVIDMFAEIYELRSCGGTSSNLPRAVPGSQAFLADRVYAPIGFHPNVELFARTGIEFDPYDRQAR